MGVRLQDVAELAGVSMKTVSNVVRDYEHVSAATRERVQKAIDELGYRPNMMGRRLATGRTGLLALSFSNVTVPYFAELSRAVSAAAGALGYRVLLEETDGTLEGERAVIASSEAGLVDGILFQPSVMSSVEISRHRGDLPIVILGEGAAPLPVDRVMIDNVAAARAATEHLIALGRRRIGFAGHESGTSQRPRSSASWAISRRSRSTASAPTRVCSSRAPRSPRRRRSGRRCRVRRRRRVDGLVCRDDLAAIGALRALNERGLRVPEDVAVTGWDNIELSRVTFPSLTTIAPD